MAATSEIGTDKQKEQDAQPEATVANLKDGVDALRVELEKLASERAVLDEEHDHHAATAVSIKDPGKCDDKGIQDIAALAIEPTAAKELGYVAMQDFNFEQTLVEHGNAASDVANSNDWSNNDEVLSEAVFGIGLAVTIPSHSPVFSVKVGSKSPSAMATATRDSKPNSLAITEEETPRIRESTVARTQSLASRHKSSSAVGGGNWRRCIVANTT